MPEASHQPPPEVVFATPRKLPKPTRLPGRVVVLDIAFAAETGGGGFKGITQKFIDGLGPRLAAWIDHHDSGFHALYAADSRFTLHRKSEYGACPPLVTPDRVRAAGVVDCIVCHNDFDGLAAAAKWLRGGHEPYPGCDADAVAIDTRVGLPSAAGRRLDEALRARPRDEELMRAIVGHLVSGADDGGRIDDAVAEWAEVARATERLAGGFVRLGARAVWTDVPDDAPPYDKTGLLLAGQRLAPVAAVADAQGVSLAAGFDSGYDFLALFGLSGGMPTRVSLPVSRRDAVREVLVGL